VPVQLPLDLTDRPVHVGDGLPFGDLADQHLIILCERHHRGRGPRALRVRDDCRLPAFGDGDDRINF
jgi:hypothetical protein